MYTEHLLICKPTLLKSRIDVRGDNLILGLQNLYVNLSDKTKQISSDLIQCIFHYHLLSILTMARYNMHDLYKGENACFQ